MKNIHKLLPFLLSGILLLSTTACGSAAGQSNTQNSSSLVQSQDAGSTTSSHKENNSVTISSQTSVPVQLDSERFDQYFKDFVRFFRYPVQTPLELNKDYHYAYFLVYESYQRGIENGRTYSQDEDGFWQIPNDELIATANELLGVSDLSLTEFTEWPFKVSKDGKTFGYTNETELPYGDILQQKTTIDGETITVSATVRTKLANEEGIPEKVSLIYTFKLLSDSGGQFYQLVSINAA